MTRSSVRLRVEQLESRLVPATASISGRILTIQGTVGNDIITVNDSTLPGPARVAVNASVAGASPQIFLFFRSDFDSLVITGLQGADTLRNNTVIPSRLDGGSGMDELQGGRGDDTLVGGPDDDTYVFGAGMLGNDTVDEGGIPVLGPTSNKGGDTLDFSLVDSALYTVPLPGGQLTAINTNEGIRIDLLSADSQAVLHGRLALTVRNPGTIENVTGSAFNDIIKGNNAANELLGSGGNDEIWGRLGNDFVSGGAGKDTLFGNDPTHLHDEFDRYADIFDMTKPVLNGATASDVVQGHSATSSILAALAASASQRDFTSDIVVMGNNRYA